MKRLATITCAAIAVGVIAGCGSSKQQALHYSFEFVHEGMDYEIISVVASEDRGYNFLTRREDGQVVLSAKDEDQNGTIDAIVLGDLDLISANSIYASGIEIARAHNRYRELHDTRSFACTISGQDYVVNSLSGDEQGSFYNTFVFSDGYGGEVVAVDEDADGKLDVIRKGVADLSECTELYLAALEEGVRGGRIVSERGRYLVAHK
jgi:hypothetical protein